MTDHPFTQVHRLADVEQRIVLADEPVDAAGLRQVVHQLGRQLRRQRRPSADAFQSRLQGRGRPRIPPRAPQAGEHLGIGQRAVTRPAIEAVAGDQGIEVVSGRRGVQFARQTHGAGERRSEGASGTPELRAQEAVVEAHVVGDETPPGQARRELIGDRRERGRLGDHRIADAGEALDRGRDAAARVDQGAPLPLDLAAPHADHRDLGHAVPRGMAAGGLDVDESDRGVESGRGVEGGRSVGGGGVDGHDQPSATQVVLSSVYFSRACSDLSLPMPDCL